jgi:hypothetical protein
MQYGIKLGLPSRGAYGKAFVNIRRPKLEDLVDYFQAGDNSVVAKNQFVNGICDTDLSKYPTGDREYVFVNLRSLVNTNIITGTVLCEKQGCGSEVVYMLDLKDCKVNQLPEDFIVDYELKFPSKGVSKKINLLTQEKEEILENYIRFYSAANIELANSDLGENLHEFARYACMFSDSTDISMVDYNVTFLRELDWSEFEVLMMYDVAFECGPEVFVHAKCDNCKQNYKIKIKTDNSFFGLSLEGLINRHRFLARASNIGFQDFLKYTMPMLENITVGEVTRINDTNTKIKAARSKRK